MKKVVNLYKNKMLHGLSALLMLIAIQTVNSASLFHCYQEKEPDSLKKYEEM